MYISLHSYQTCCSISDFLKSHLLFTFSNYYQDEHFEIKMAFTNLIASKTSIERTLFALATVLFGSIFQVHGHAIGVHQCVTTAGDLRIFVQHWHYSANLVSTYYDGDLIITNDVTGVTSTISPSGFLFGVDKNQLPGCPVGVIATSAADHCYDDDYYQSSYDDWVYFDLPVSCDTTNSYTIVDGGDNLLTDGCSKLFPVTINDFDEVLCSEQPSSPPSGYTMEPSNIPSDKPSSAPSDNPSSTPSDKSSSAPSYHPSRAPYDKRSLCASVPKRKMCKGTDGCFWRSNNNGGGRCRQCSFISRRILCQKRGCRWDRTAKVCS